MRTAPQLGTVCARGIRRVIDLGVEAGVPRDLLVGIAGVADLDRLEPDARLPMAAEVAIWQMIARHAPDPGFGIRDGATFDARRAGLLGYVVSFAPTLRDSLRALARYFHIFTEAVDARLDRSGAVLTLVGNPSLGPAEPLAQSFRLASVLRSLRVITGIDVVPAEVNFAHEQPRSILAHREFFRCPIHFGTRATRIEFRTADLQLPTLRADPTLAGYLGDYADQMLASLVRGETLRYRVRAVIWSQSATGKSTLRGVASALGMSPRTLQRRLREEGTSLNRELQAVRKMVSMAALRNREVAVDDVAFLLGYAEPSAFYRSFKRWTGQTPQEFRRRVA